MNVQKKDTNFLGTFNSRTKIHIVKKEDGKQDVRRQHFYPHRLVTSSGKEKDCLRLLTNKTEMKFHTLHMVKKLREERKARHILSISVQFIWFIRHNPVLLHILCT